MTALRHTHRQMDWRKLNVAHGNRQRRCHDRQTYGILQPMDCDRQPIPMWAWMLVKAIVWVIAILYATKLWVMPS